ncbi:MAG: c-type cytochrome [Phycisphaera sp.]|nr:c-type cytochrome [Phycisphaera sp.]
MTRMTVVMFCTAVVAGSLWSGHAAASPVVPGYEQLKASGKSDAVMRGELLISELNCLSCHTASDAVAARIGTKPAPDLSNAGARLTPQYLRKYLTDPHGVKPGATMPDIFHASEAKSRDGAVDFLVNYLVSRGGPIKLDESSANSSMVSSGEKLFHSLGCIACHAPAADANKTKVPSVPLANLAEKTTLAELTKFLMDPAAIRPGGRMPSFRLGRDEAANLAAYLLRDQLDNPQNKAGKPSKQPGMAWEYYEDGMSANAPDWSKMKPKVTGVAPDFTLNPSGNKHRGDNFAYRYTGTLHIEKPGKYTFWTGSDDGSELFIGDKQVVKNWGAKPYSEVHGDIELDAGDYPLTVTYWEVGGQEQFDVHWRGPGIKKKSAIPTGVLSAEGGTPMLPLNSEPDFAVDAQKAQMGERMFTMLKCVQCHSQGQQASAAPAPPFARKAPAFADLNVDNAEGCLGDKIRKAVPKYGFSDDQKADIKAALAARAKLNQKRGPHDAALYTLATFNCIGCHNRDGVGGPGEVREKLFDTTIKIDLGDEGRIPPTLTGVGSKLRADAIEKIVFNGELHVREYMATRMPTFPREAASALVDTLVAADFKPGDDTKPEFDQKSVAAGRRLVGVSPSPSKSGLGCINCHNVAGQTSIGIPGIDLATVHDRLNPGWFKRWLANPVEVKPGTRMPGFWAGASIFPDVLGGDAGKQQEAIWNYLSLGKSMPLPAGFSAMSAKNNELVPLDVPVMYRTFVDGASPRGIVVGYPEKVNIAFDANVVRLAEIWRGRFWDPSNTWTGRSGGFGKPLGTDVMDMPNGPAIAFLESEDQPWPNPDIKKERNVGGDFKGYRLDKERRPIFHYNLKGVDIEEALIPQLKQGGVTLMRRFTVDAPSDPSGLYVLVAEGKKIAKDGDAFVVDGGKLTVTVVKAADNARIREVGGTQQLVIPATKKNAVIEVDYKW